jgi:RecA-family ATPase
VISPEKRLDKLNLEFLPAASSVDDLIAGTQRSAEEAERRVAEALAHREAARKAKAQGAPVASVEPVEPMTEAPRVVSPNGHASPEPPAPESSSDYGAQRAEPASTVVILEPVVASSLAGREVPPRQWLVRDLIPDRVVTILSGDGDVGKSLIALQLAVAVANATDWIGTMPEFGPSIVFCAEDELDEIHRRLADICAARDLKLEALSDLHIVSLAGKDAVLAVTNARGLVSTALWRALVSLIAKISPRLVVIDNLADVFEGNEISRPQARQFVGLLRGAAIEFAHAVLLLAHPSLTGLNSGSGTSGSTGWNNASRSRLYMTRRKDGEGNESDPDLRVLTLKKANHARAGVEIVLRWRAGRFDPDGPLGGFDRLAQNATADVVFLDVLERLNREKRNVSPHRSTAYAPTVIARQPDARGMTMRALQSAMDRLYAAGKIATEQCGSPARPRSRIVMSCKKDEQ